MQKLYTLNEAVSVTSTHLIKYLDLIKKALKAKRYDSRKTADGNYMIVDYDNLGALVFSADSLIGYSLSTGSDKFHMMPADVNTFRKLLTLAQFKGLSGFPKAMKEYDIDQLAKISTSNNSGISLGKSEVIIVEPRKEIKTSEQYIKWVMSWTSVQNFVAEEKDWLDVLKKLPIKERGAVIKETSRRYNFGNWRNVFYPSTFYTTFGIPYPVELAEALIQTGESEPINDYSNPYYSPGTYKNDPKAEAAFYNMIKPGREFGIVSGADMTMPEVLREEGGEIPTRYVKAGLSSYFNTHYSDYLEVDFSEIESADDFMDWVGAYGGIEKFIETVDPETMLIVFDQMESDEVAEVIERSGNWPRPYQAVLYPSKFYRQFGEEYTEAMALALLEISWCEPINDFSNPYYNSSQYKNSKEAAAAFKAAIRPRKELGPEAGATMGDVLMNNGGEIEDRYIKAGLEEYITKHYSEYLEK